MAKTTAQVRAKVRREPIKAGSTKPRNIGRALISKLVLIRQKQIADKQQNEQNG
jgi:hypothetical protein